MNYPEEAMDYPKEERSNICYLYTNTTADMLLNHVVYCDHNEIFEKFNNGDLFNELIDNEPYYPLDMQKEPQEPQEIVPIESLPNEVLIAIFAFNDPADHCRIRRVCREWSQMKLEGYFDIDEAKKASSYYIIYQMGQSVLERYCDSLILKLKIGNTLNGCQIRATNGVMTHYETVHMNEMRGYSKYWTITKDGKRYLSRVAYYGINDDYYCIDYNPKGLLWRFYYDQDLIEKEVLWNEYRYIQEIHMIVPQSDKFTSPNEQLLIKWSPTRDVKATLRLYSGTKTVNYDSYSYMARMFD